MTEQNHTTTTAPAPPTHDIAEAVQQHAKPIRQIVQAVEQVVVGQHAMVEGLLIGLLTNGHVLLEGVPGLAKTLTVSSLARAIHAKFSRIQFTPDLLPADLLGTLIYNPASAEFTPRKGPIFANIILADEINRAPAKVQSALLEAMQERQVTIGDTTYPLDNPFLVLATQNPVEQEGTYPLPEAQTDRFMLKLKISYPSKADERRVLDRMASIAPPTQVQPVITIEQILDARAVVDRIYIDPKVRDYIVDIVHATRQPADYNLKLAHLIEYGASPRATIALTLAARARAFLDARGFVTPHDIKSIAHEVLRHRIIPTYEAEAENMTTDAIIATILDHLPVP
ncbi:MAG: AAA family ATPase [Phycisphaerales bacterium]